MRWWDERYGPLDTLPLTDPVHVRRAAYREGWLWQSPIRRTRSSETPVVHRLGPPRTWRRVGLDTWAPRWHTVTTVGVRHEQWPEYDRYGNYHICVSNVNQRNAVILTNNIRCSGSFP